ncbi:ATP-dependent DNA helicase RecG [Rickettsia endosymbiont of Halotydeus destructor]|uniref:ATP-dependent DNA helicase RecG n=1 Tax=Rickettsia endosymbiont of Halotydeus destructor TaxID=2996754 RepID=UPI003BB011A0
MLISLEKFLFSPVKTQISISPNAPDVLKRLGIDNIRDLLFYRPVSYQTKIVEPNLAEVKEGQLIQTKVTIEQIFLPVKKHQPLKVTAANDTGSLLMVFFHKLPPFIFNKLKIGTTHIISGKAQFFDHYLQISHPEFIYNPKFEKAYSNDLDNWNVKQGVSARSLYLIGEHTNPPKFYGANSSNQKSIEPIYPLTFGINNKQIYSYILKLIDIFEEKYNKLKQETNIKIIEYIESLLADLKILHFYEGLDSRLRGNDIKEPGSDTEVKGNASRDSVIEKAIKNLAAKELIANQISLYNIRKQIQLKQGNSFKKATDIQQSVLEELDFELTEGQQQVIEEIERDQQSATEMMRLLQGDVGAGKTLVALLTMLNAVYSGFQTTLMAPTDLLANQHYEFFVKALSKVDIKIALLTGKILGTARKNIMEQLENGEIDILIGTHALFQEKVNFKNLGYIVIDEQHRFGVQQRLNLINKGEHPDVLVMTATPIPRSLALTVFGDMAISKLMSKPKNRLPITTNVMPFSKIENIIEVLDKKLNVGERIYWICPLIDQNDKEVKIAENDTPLIDVMSRFAAIDLVYPNIGGIIHGKMKNEQKDAIMRQFKEGEIKLLVATTVIEVGIDVPEATLIVIENAEQFGLAQLHQLRGRVGRGANPSYCILLYNPKRLSKVARERFEIMKAINNGFYIAEQDLKLRGGGEILGMKQSGEVQFFFADIVRDLDMLINANKFAETTASENNDFINFQIKLFARTELSELN